MDVQLKIALAIMVALAAQALVVGLITFVKLVRVPGVTADAPRYEEPDRVDTRLRPHAA